MLAKDTVQPNSTTTMAGNTPVVPGPKNRPLIGNLPEFLLDPFKFLTNCSQEYGDITKIHLPLLGTTYFVNRPEYIEDILVAKQNMFIRPKLYKLLTPFLGNGLALAEGEVWLRNRRLLQPAFQREHLLTYLPIMVEQIAKMLSQWHSQPSSLRALDEDMTQLTLEIATKTLLGTDLTGTAGDIGKAFREVMRGVNSRIFNPLHLPQFIPTPGNRRFREASQQLEKVVYAIIAEHHSNPTQDDLLARCMHAQSPLDASRMTDKQLRDEVMTIMLSGHESTTSILTWAWYLLANHPEVEAKLYDEVNSLLAGRTPTARDLSQLVYTRLIAKEVLRLYPVLWFMGRCTTQELVLADYSIPAGSTIMVSPWLIQRDSRFYADPHAFRPERWQTDQLKSLPRFAYFPFGGGPRQCIGSDFAFQEIVLILAMVAQQFRFSYAPGQSVKLKPTAHLTLRPPKGVKIVVTAR